MLEVFKERQEAELSVNEILPKDIVENGSVLGLGDHSGPVNLESSNELRDTGQQLNRASGGGKGKR